MSGDQPARGGSWRILEIAPSTLERALVVSLAVVIVGSVSAVGAVHTAILVPVAIVALAAAAVAMLLQKGAASAPWPGPAVVALALSAFTLIQTINVPLTWLDAIAPTNADVWRRALLPFNEQLATGSISLDPGASSVESLKWLVYGCVFFAAAALAARRGAALGIVLVFGSAVVTALVTIGHELAHATKLFGLYQPRGGFTHISPLLNANNLAGYLNLGALSGVGLMMARRPLVPPWLTGLGVAALVAVVARSASRAGVAALPIGVLALAILVRVTRSRGGARRSSHLPEWVLGATIVGAGLLVALGGTPAVWTGLFNENMAKLDLVLWAKPLLGDYGWLGVGRGAFESVFSAYRPEPGPHVIFSHIENFPAQWASEWGVPVAALALAAFAWMLRPGRMGVMASAVFAGPWVGVMVLLAQNLLDLGLEIPAVSIAAAAALGSIWGDRRRARGPPVPSRIAAALRLSSPFWIAAAGLLPIFAFAGIARHGGRSVAAERDDLLASYERLEPADHEGVRAFRGDLRAAMLRHPADHYFSLLGASQAWRSRAESPIPWLQRTLERAPINGRAHLLLAEVLAARGAKRQAFFELRLAMEQDTATIGRAADLAASWSTELDELLLAVPVGPAGSRVLDEISRRLVRPGQAAIRARCEVEAIARDPTAVAPRIRQVYARIEALAAPPGADLGSDRAVSCDDRARCEREIDEHVRIIDAMSPDSSFGAQLRARMLVALGRPDEAELLLAAACIRPRDRSSCLELRVDLASKSSDQARLEAALKEYQSDRCTSPATCAAGHAGVAGYRAQRGDFRSAAASLERAAREEPTEERWMAAAEMAERAGMHAKAVEALEKVAQKRGSADAALQQRIAADRARAAGTMLR